MESILSAMIQDLENRWGDGMDITKYSCRLGIGDTQGATMWVHKGADLELYS